MKLTVWLYIEDFDNPELPPDSFQEQLEDAVRNYNEEYGTIYDPYKTVMQYIKNKSLTIY